jgi:hypothetical protein
VRPAWQQGQPGDEADAGVEEGQSAGDQRAPSRAPQNRRGADFASDRQAVAAEELRHRIASVVEARAMRNPAAELARDDMLT